MSLVVNDVVSMEWDSSGWSATKKDKRGNCRFFFASKEFDTKDGGKLTVFFDPYFTFLWSFDDETYCDAKELKKYIKTNYDASFPDNCDECTMLISYNPDGSLDINEDIIENLGLSDHLDEMIDRTNDIHKYSEEVEIKMSDLY